MRFVAKIKNFLLDIFFPSFCAGCKKEGSFLCQNCKEKIPKNNHPCFLKNSKIKKIYCATEYKQTTIKSLVYELKYNSTKSIANNLSEILIKHLKISGFEKNKNQILIPVPLHKSRLKQRGFNQSLLLAENISKQLQIPVVENVLFRTKNTKHQTKQESKIQREKNIKGAFVCKNIHLIKDKEIILIDDILTTGATLKECAKEISKHKPKNILAFVVAK